MFCALCISGISGRERFFFLCVVVCFVGVVKGFLRGLRVGKVVKGDEGV